tara:strand:- start:119 stop:490 length:372 start_codon:yes stop_codon:yes gene_type:complete
MYEPSMFINSNLPENSRILLFREWKGFFLERDYVWADPLIQVYVDYSKFKNEKDYYEELKRLNITHILINEGFQIEDKGSVVSEIRYSPRILELTGNLLKKYTINLYDQTQYNGDRILIYELK